VRQDRQATLIVLAVDASGSMGAPRRMEAAKGAVLSLLLDAYQRRDRIALVTFGGGGSRLVLRPTGSVEVARARLASLPTGGRTPLAAGIVTAIQVAEAGRPAGYQPLLVVVSDGRATEAPPGNDPLRAALKVAGQVRRQGMPALVVDAEGGRCGLGLGQSLAEAMGAVHVMLDRLTAGGLADAVRQARGLAWGRP
jgi:magnesium chelatase subunit D